LRRIFALITTLALALTGLIATPAQAVVLSDGTYSCSTGLPSASTPNFTITAGVVSLGTNCSGSLVLPEGVTNVGVSAFENAGITSISFPASIFIIEANAFKNASSLTSITFPTGLGDIGAGAFQGASSLQNVYFEGTEAPSSANDAFGSLPNEATAHILANATGFGPSGGNWKGFIVSRAYVAGMMSDGTFNCNTGVRQNTPSSPNITVEGATVTSGYDCTGSVTVPSGVTSIGGYSFNYGVLSSIDLPSSLRTIGFAAFRNADDLVTVNMRSGVTSIGGEAFQNADSLVEITIPATVTSMGESVFANTDVLETVTFAGGITSVPNETFMNAQVLETVTLPNSVTSIGVEAFAGTAALQSVNMPSSLTFIGDNAFEDSSLPSINIPGSVTSIGASAFRSTNLLTSVTLNSGLVTIGNYAFANSGLTAVEIPNSVTSLGRGAFSGAMSLASVTLSSGLTEIPYDAFNGATSLDSIDVPSGVTSIADYAFDGATSLRSISLPNTLTSIGEIAFGGTDSLTTIVIPSSVTQIGVGAFSGASGLRSITIPNGITNIQQATFAGNTSLTSVTLPSSLTSIAAIAFEGAPLASIYFLGNAPSTVDNTAFNSVPNTAKVLTQSGATGFGGIWNGFTVASATANGSYACATGAPANAGQRFLVANREIVNALSCSGSVVIPPGITSIAEGAFQIAAVSEIIVPASLATFSSDSLNNPSLLSIMVAPNNATFSSVNGVLFNAARTALLRYPAAKAGTSYSIPSSVSGIGALAFSGAGSLSSFTFAGNAPTVGGDAFAGVASQAQAIVGANATGFGAAGSSWNGLIVSIAVSQNQNNNQQNNNQVAPVVASSAPAFRFATRPFLSGNATSFTLNGANLSTVKSVKVGGTETKITAKSDGELVIELPAGSEGSPEVILVHASGTLIIQGLLRVVKPYAEKRTIKLPGFKGGAPTQSALQALKKAYLSGSPANIVSCIATVATKASAKDVAFALKGAKATCQAMSEYSSFINQVDVRVNKSGTAGSKPTLAVTFDRSLTGN